jgi:tetratricopeptide (TPR) repeat protein
MSPGGDAAFDEARLLAARGELSDAEGALDAILERSPAHVGALLLKASLRLEQREGEQALSFFRRAVELAPRSAEALNGLARCLHALGRDTEGLDVAQAARESLAVGDNFRHTAPVYLTLLWCLREQRRFKEALAVAEEGLARTPDAVLAQWASVVEEELAEAEKDEC